MVWDGSADAIMEDLLKRVDTVLTSTGIHDEIKDQASLDEFVRLKTDTQKLLGNIREQLERRSMLKRGDPNPASAAVIEASHRIRRDIEKARELAMAARSQLDRDVELGLLGDDQRQQREGLLAVTFGRIDEYARLERGRREGGAQGSSRAGGSSGEHSSDLESGGGSGVLDRRRRLLDGPGPGWGGGGGGEPGGGDVFSAVADGGVGTALTEDEVMEQLQEFKERDQVLDRHLEELSTGVERLKRVAEAVEEELDKTSAVYERIGSKMGKNKGKAADLNKNMKSALEEAKTGERLCVHAILIFILLGVLAEMWETFIT